MLAVGLDAQSIIFPGVCLGLQIAVIEFARNVLGLKGRITWCVT